MIIEIENYKQIMKLVELLCKLCAVQFVAHVELLDGCLNTLSF